MKRPFFAVLGGMGTLATESYVRLVDAATHARQRPQAHPRTNQKKLPMHPVIGSTSC